MKNVGHEFKKDNFLRYMNFGIALLTLIVCNLQFIRVQLKLINLIINKCNQMQKTYFHFTFFHLIQKS
jgi:hypothetical protein